ncbi:hypothetical protein SLS62_002865 [Diatrype stigma]|uniref:Macro domain-containing protein n=1 Tax=Diatrype stigma TaxID=117547 RepID=A0AAN9UZA6_9PEZI
MASTMSILDVLDFLLDEAGYSLGHHHHHHHHHHHASHPDDNSNRRAISHMDSWPRLVLLDQLLCMRHPEPELPPDVAGAIDRILRARLARRLATSSLTGITPRFVPASGSSSIHHPPEDGATPNTTAKESGTPTPAVQLCVWKGDITTLAHATAVVNAANARLLGCFRPRHPCIDNAIHAAAGPGLRRACWDLMAAQGFEEPAGSAKVTPGFGLHARYVIHTVGPQLSSRRRRGDGEEAASEPSREPGGEGRRLLASCYAACLDAAEGLEPLPGGRKVLVFCCVSTGMFGFPADEGCRVAVDAVLRWIGMHAETTVTDIVFNVFTEADLQIYQSRISQLVDDHVLLTLADDNSSRTTTSLPPTSPVAGLPSPSSLLSPSEDMMTPLLEEQAALIARARHWLSTSSRLIISAGAGLSAATGLDYTSSALFAEHHHGFERYGLDSLYSVFGFDGWPSEAARWSYNMHHLDVVRGWRPRNGSTLYEDLLSFVRRRFETSSAAAGDDDVDDDHGIGSGSSKEEPRQQEKKEKNWFVRTSNADGFFAKHGFDAARVCTPQGQYALVQCAARCRDDAVWPSGPFVDDATEHLDPVTQHLPDDYEVPTCRFCGAALTLCVRGGNYFIEAPFEELNRRYAEFVEGCLAPVAGEADGKRRGRGSGEGDAVTTILELGVGMNTPSVLRWHNENLVQRAGGKFRLVRLGMEAAGCVDPALEEAGVAVGLYGDLTRLFAMLDIQ